MKNIIYIVVNYGAHFLFVVLEIICFALIINYNQGQKEIFINSTNLLSSRLNSKVDQFTNYLELEAINDSLQIQNARLLQRFINTDVTNVVAIDSMAADTSKYELISSKICNTTFRLKNNSLTICDGTDKGLEVGMGVVSVNGIIGQITAVSNHYARVMSLLHTQSRISAVIRGSQAYGTLRWPGFDPRITRLEGIPAHIELNIGDTIETSGFSTVFPKGMEIGRIIEFKKANGSYRIDVQLSNDPSRLDAIYVIKNNGAAEQLALEASEQL